MTVVELRQLLRDRPDNTRVVVVAQDLDEVVYEELAAETARADLRIRILE